MVRATTWKESHICCTLTSFKIADQTFTIDVNGLNVPVLRSVQNIQEYKNNGIPNGGWWQSYGLERVADRLIGPATNLPGQAGEAEIVLLALEDSTIPNG